MKSSMPGPNLTPHRWCSLAGWLILPTLWIGATLAMAQDEQPATNPPATPNADTPSTPTALTPAPSTSSARTDPPPPRERTPLAVPEGGWSYGDPAESTSPTNFRPRDRHDLRPTRTDEAYDQIAATLRQAYAQPRDQWPAAHIAEGGTFAELGPVTPAQYPEDNPHSEAKAQLGQMLFFDGRVSGSGQISCNSCHVAELGWADGRARSLGHGALQLQRNTPSLLNSGFADELFADGRSDSLEQLTVEVIHNRQEMRGSGEDLEKTLGQIEGYGPLFAAAFGDPQITIERVARAIATHVRGLVSEPSADLDRFLAGDADRLSDAAIRGLHLFRTEARCINCHNGPRLTDQKYHNLGLTYFGRKHEDRGRYLVTQDPEDVGKFKTPGLRNVARTAPYTHTGFFDLPGLINLYNAGGARPRPREHVKDDPLLPTTSELLVPLHLNEQDKADLLAFLEALTERRRRDLIPDLPK